MSRLIESLATTEALAAIFSEGSLLQAMLDFEAALARAQSRLGLIPEAAGRAIGEAARSENFDIEDLARRALRAGTPAIPLVQMLTDRVRAAEPASAGYVHWGATSQDVADTALILLLRRCRETFRADQARLDRALERLSEQHAGSVMLARTLLQPATPITFGLKVAGWLAAVRRSWARMESAFEESLLLQFGGSSGTLASLGEHGLAVSDALAQELALACAEAPWHAHRDRLAALMAALGVYAGSLGKMALDVSLLMQTEAGEAAEPGDAGRGGSSAMPHKRNPVACTLALGTARRMPGLVASFLACMLQEHERAAGGWQAEWPAVASIVQAAGLALESMVEMAEGLTVDPGRMRRNLKATRGAVFSERAMMLLGSRLGREAAHRILEDAARQVAEGDRTLAEVLAQMPEVKGVLTPTQIEHLQSPEEYLGSAELFRVRQLGRGR